MNENLGRFPLRASNGSGESLPPSYREVSHPGVSDETILEGRESRLDRFDALDEGALSSLVPRRARLCPTL